MSSIEESWKFSNLLVIGVFKSSLEDVVKESLGNVVVFHLLVLEIFQFEGLLRVILD